MVFVKLPLTSGYTQFNKMSNTTRKDKNGKEYKESLKKKDGHFRCRCEYCLGKKDVIEKIAEKEMKEEVRVIEMEENIDFDIIWDELGEFCNDYCCTVKDEGVVKKYVVNFGEK